MNNSCCKLKYTSIFQSLEYNDSDIVFKIPLDSMLPFDANHSGLWRPFFYDRTVYDNNNNFWFSHSNTSSSDKGVYNPVASGCYKNYIGIEDFITINNLKLKNWTITGGTYNIDLVPSLNTRCYYLGNDDITDKKSILFWYRYYDMGRLNDNRIAPGLELYISEGEYFSYKISDTEYFSVSDNLSPDVVRLSSSLNSIGISGAENKAKVLATGPQFDWVTEILASGRITDSNPSVTNDPTSAIRQNGIILPPSSGRTDYGLDAEKLRQMSLKTYRNIGVDNYILNKKALVNKLQQKYGGALTVSSNSTVSLESKFSSSVGPNVNIRMSGALQINSNNKAYYTMECAVGGLSFQTSKSNTVSVYDLNYAYRSDKNNEGLSIYWRNWPGNLAAKNTENVDIFKTALNTTPMAHDVIDSTSGIFNPKLPSIAFHGLGGVNVGGSEGAHFIPGFDDSSIEKSASTIRISINAGPNSRYKIADFIFIDYLRTTTKPTCEPFLNYSNQLCDCFSLKRLDPSSSTFNTSSNLYVPDISLYHLPSGKFYGGFTSEEANKRPLINGHPAPQTSFPKDHQLIKDMSLAIGSKNFLNGNISPGSTSNSTSLTNRSLNCDYSANGQGSGIYELRIPTVGKIFLNYIGTNTRFGILWNNNSKFNTSGATIFASHNGTICLEKTGIEPQTISINVQVSGSGYNPWGWYVDFKPHNYLKDQFLNTVKVSGQKGFFHPNSGWISGIPYSSKPQYYNHSPVIPYQFDNKTFDKHARLNYNAKEIYNEEYLNGYNYLVDVSGLNFQERNLFDQSKYIGFKINNSNNYLVTPNYLKFNYTRMDSPILTQIPFRYVNLNISGIEYGRGEYPFGDFTYDKISSNKIKISTKFLGQYRGQASFDIPSLGSDKIVIKTTGNIEKEYTVTQVSGSTSGYFVSVNPALDPAIPSGGLFYKKSKSLLVYNPSETYKDEILNLGKWGNLLVYNRLGDYDTRNDHYNLSTLRSTTASPYTNLSWSAPIKLKNILNNNDVNFYINPRSLILYNDGKYPPSGFYTETFSTVGTLLGSGSFGSGNHIISNTSPPSSGQISLPIYIGSDTGMHNIVVNLTKWNKNGQIKLYYNNAIVDTDIINGSGTKPTTSGIVDTNQKQVLLSFNKNSSLPTFGEIVIENNIQNCYSNKQPAFITSSIVYIDQTAAALTKDNRVSYYAHTLPSTNTRVGSTSSTKDRLSYLDLHLFGDKLTNQIQNIAETGSIYFENALLPQNNLYYNNMLTKYNGDKYWFDISDKTHWGILTSKNMLLLPHIVYTFTKNISYDCDENTKKCSSRYSNDICSNQYSFSIENMFDALGLSGVPQDLFDITIKTYPNDCNQIDDCCLTLECISSQTGLIKQCNDKYKKSFQCKDLSCPPSGLSLSGNYTVTQEMYEFKIKDRIPATYFTDTVETVFLDNISGYNNTHFSNYNTNSYIINLDNQNILHTTDSHNDLNYVFSDQQVVGLNNKLCSITQVGSNELLKYVYNQSGNIPLTTNHHLYNELIYRSYVPHPNVINGPLFEYDPKATQDDTETIYNFNFGLKKCISSDQQIMSMVLDDNINVSVNFTISSGQPYYVVLCNGVSKKLKMPLNNMGGVRVAATTWPQNTSGCSHIYPYAKGRTLYYSSINNKYKASPLLVTNFGDSIAYSINNALSFDTNLVSFPKQGDLDCKTVQSNIVNVMKALDPTQSLTFISCDAKDLGPEIITQNCVVPCGASLYDAEENPASQQQKDQYAKECPDATNSKDINATYYRLEGGTANNFASWSMVKKTVSVKIKDNYNLHYGKKNLQEIVGKRQVVDTTYKVNNVCSTDGVTATDVRNCCEGYDISSNLNKLNLTIKKYKNLYFINVSTNSYITDYYATNPKISFCEPITPSQYFMCPKINLTLGPDVFFTDSVQSKVYNCTRGLIS